MAVVLSELVALRTGSRASSGVGPATQRSGPPWSQSAVPWDGCRVSQPSSGSGDGVSCTMRAIVHRGSRNPSQPWASAPEGRGPLQVSLRPNRTTGQPGWPDSTGLGSSLHGNTQIGGIFLPFSGRDLPPTSRNNGELAIKSNEKQGELPCYFLVQIFHSPHISIEKKVSDTERDIDLIS